MNHVSNTMDFDVYNVGAGILIANVWSLSLLAGGVVFSLHGNAHFAVGPSEHSIVAGFPVNTWPRWGCVMSLSVLSQVAASVVGATLMAFAALL